MGTLDILKQLIDAELEMPANRVWAYNNSIEMPIDKGLFVVLYFESKEPYANNNKYETVNGIYSEVQSINVIENIVISCISKDTSARDRCHEILMALNSNYAEQLQERNQMHFSTIGEIYDASFLEETSMLNRFDVRLRVTRNYVKIKAVDYYDKFPNTSKLEPEYHIET